MSFRVESWNGGRVIDPLRWYERRPRVRVIQEPILVDVNSAHVGVDKVASASPAKVLRKDPAVADNDDVVAVIDVAIKPLSDREGASLNIGDGIDSMLSDASNPNPTGGQFSKSIVPLSRKLDSVRNGVDFFSRICFFSPTQANGSPSRANCFLNQTYTRGGNDTFATCDGE